jgi:predicted AlkP superfamily pyrophosphatase or phosphodiesterase
MAAFVLRTYQPHVLLLHLSELDSVQHDEGPESERALATLEQIDGLVGEILETLESSGLADTTTIAVVSDHGFLGIQQQLQPNAVFKREGLITVNSSGAVTDWRAWFHSSGGSGFVYLKDPDDAALRARVFGILKDIHADQAKGVRQIWDRAGLDQLGAHPEAAFGLDVVDGFYTSSGHDALVKPTTSKGGHGFDPSRPELRASLVISGPAVSRRGSLGVVRMTQIAPTLAGILGVGLSPQADGGLEIRVDR